MTQSNSTQIAPTPKADLMAHFQNFGEGGMYFSASLGLALATVYFKQLEIVLALAYIGALMYSILSFDNAPRMAFLRIAAITAGVIVGIRELLMLFWVPVTSVIIGVLVVALLLYMGYRWLQIALTPEVRR
ncbi:MAG: hypothetical protein ACR9NN_24895 [Nostochopsis sp.]